MAGRKAETPTEKVEDQVVAAGEQNDSDLIAEAHAAATAAAEALAE